MCHTLCALPSGLLASGSADHTIRAWDVFAGNVCMCVCVCVCVCVCMCMGVCA